MFVCQMYKNDVAKVVVDIVVVVVGNVMVEGLNVEGELNLTPFLMEFLI